MRSERQKYHGGSRGYALLGIMMLIAIASMIIASTLDFSASNAHTGYNQKEHTQDYFRAEETLGLAASWLRTNSKDMVSCFNRSNFYKTFDRVTAGYGSNDTGLVRIPALLRKQGTTDTVMLSNFSELGTSLFPNTTNTDTGASYNSVARFAAASLGSDKVRITLVDALAVDPTKDFGDTDNGNPPPQTDFYPIYRVDSMNAADRGAHVYGYMVGNLIYNYGVGFYGRDLMDLRQMCDSYISNSGGYSNASRRANCSAGSNATLQIHQSELLYGSAQTNGSINVTSPFGGRVCSDFTANCPHSGLTCQGEACGVPGLPGYSDWNIYCPTNQGDLVANNDTLTVAGNNPNQKCWDTVTVGSGKTLTLTTTNYSYFIDTFDIANSGQVVFTPDPATSTINLYVRKFTGDRFNGNQMFNTNNKPYQLRIHYLGTDPLTLDGNAEVRAFLVAPYAGVTVSGSFEYLGGIKATTLSATGSGGMHYDESGDFTTLSDLQFTIRNVTEHYR